MLTIDPNTCFQKNALITYIVHGLDSIEGPLCIDKAALQRIVYIVQEIYSLPLGYDFALYNYGPYSADLTGDLEYTEYLGGVKGNYGPGGSAACSSVLKTGEQSGDFIREALEFLKEHHVENLDGTLVTIGSFASYELDILASLHMICRELDEKERSRKLLAVKLKEIKPQAHDQIVEKMLQFLVDQKKILINE